MDDIQQRYTQAQQSSEELQQANGATQTRLIEAELQLRNTVQQENKTCKTLWLQNQALQEEVEAVHLSNVRLLHLMSQVPVLKDYLEWNEINSEFVFLGYPTRYFHQQNSDDKFNESGETTARPSAKSNGKPHPASTSLLFNGTGVEDGVYAGVSPSKNVWLSGEWADHLRLILSAENTFTRLKRIKVWELEEAARLCDNLPTGSDLLQCRRKDKDYWVPYKVFTEAQAFKNKYYPKIPALSHFYPFLMRLNHIWNDKLSDRTKALKRENSQLKQKLSKLENSASDGSRFLSLPANPHSNHNNYREVAPRSNGMNRSNINDTNIHYNNSNTYEVLLDISRELSALQREHEKLRREVRLRVTSQG
ncbi:hypothetical protein AGDE_05847 [Angomonas deanei]|uniref:Uncharacterized protein n=1 Tax=Angomonas deanei TaxID=59799 RepID=A0A7G2CDZ3_9TRYP|nr:hypothetical protein AGDE_05847 [Angomonas deanei]CAD2216913.1 hypothetical protein, conserved [Angomonas deanei]|eukprot:EPY38085.1 hypothetical protein AGDE_05847 [Angomonas deanei]